MSHKDFEGVTDEDLELFKTLVMKFYQATWEESYQRLRNDIEKRLLGRDINKSYKPRLINELEDLKDAVVSRLIRIHKILQPDGGIQHLDLMLKNRAKHVFYEELRRILREARAVELDNPTTPQQPVLSANIDKELEEKEERAIKLNCYRECLNKLPERTLNIFLEYYRQEELPPKPRAEARLRFALELANLSASEATPEQAKRAKNNLDSMISKWKRNHLDPCLQKCLKRKLSRP